MQINPLSFLLSIAVLLFSPSPDSQADTDSRHPFVITGVVVNSGASRLLNNFVTYLSQESGYPMQAIFVDSYNELSKLLRDHPEAIGWTCGAPFIEDNIKDGQQLVSIPLLNGKPLYYSLIVRAVGRPERTLSDFGGQVLAYSDPRSNSGFLAPSYRLKQQNIDIRKHFRLLLHVGNHERSIESLINGLADVAAIDEYVWIEYSKIHPDINNSLEVIERIGPYPFTPLVAGKSVSAHVVERLRKSLENMPKSRRGQQLLSNFGLDGFVQQPVSFYQPIQNMYRHNQPTT